MSAVARWQDWSCDVRVALDATDGTPTPADLRVAVGVVRELMDDVAASVSRFHAGSDLLRVNAAAGRMVPVAPLTVTLLQVALDAARRTDGLVDPTVGVDLVRAGYDRDIRALRAAGGGQAPVTPSDPARSVVRGDHRDVHLDPTLRLVGLPYGLQLDLGATAKAWTVDEAARRVAARTGAACLVEIGGDLASAGAPHRSWRVDVAERAGEPAERVDLATGALATSSVTGRRWRRGADWAHHLIDPRTGRPTAGPLRTVTVWAPSALEANVASTAALVGPGEGTTPGASLDRALAGLTAGSAAARAVTWTGEVVRIGDWPTAQVAA